MNIIDKIKKDTNNAFDIIYKEININNEIITLVYSEVLTNTSNITEMILKDISKIINNKTNINEDLFSYLYNSLPNPNITNIKDYTDLIEKLLDGYVIFINKEKYFGMEVKASLDRGISIATDEVSVRGPKDSFTENFNKNLGLIRRRIKSEKLLC